MRSTAFLLVIVVGTHMASAWISTRIMCQPIPSLRMMVTSTPQKTPRNTENNPAGFSTNVLGHIDAALDTLSSRSNGRLLSMEEVQGLMTSLEAIIDDARSPSADHDHQTADDVDVVAVTSSPQTTTTNTTANNYREVNGTRSKLANANIKPTGYSSGGQDPAISDVDATAVAKPLQPKSSSSSTNSGNHNGSPKSYGTRSKLANANIKPTGYSSGGLAPAISDVDAMAVAKPLQPKSSSSSTNSGNHNGSPKSYGTRSKLANANIKPTGYSSGGQAPAISDVSMMSMTSGDDSKASNPQAQAQAVFLVNTVLVAEPVDAVVLSPSPSSLSSTSLLSPSTEATTVTGTSSSSISSSSISSSDFLAADGQGLAPSLGACDMTITGHPDFVLNVFQLLDGGLCSVDTKVHGLPTYLPTLIHTPSAHTILSMPYPHTHIPCNTHLTHLLPTDMFTALSSGHNDDFIKGTIKTWDLPSLYMSYPHTHIPCNTLLTHLLPTDMFTALSSGHNDGFIKGTIKTRDLPSLYMSHPHTHTPCNTLLTHLLPTDMFTALSSGHNDGFIKGTIKTWDLPSLYMSHPHTLSPSYPCCPLIYYLGHDQDLGPTDWTGTGHHDGAFR